MVFGCHDTTTLSPDGASSPLGWIEDWISELDKDPDNLIPAIISGGPLESFCEDKAILINFVRDLSKRLPLSPVRSYKMLLNEQPLFYYTEWRRN